MGLCRVGPCFSQNNQFLGGFGVKNNPNHVIPILVTLTKVIFCQLYI